MCDMQDTHTSAQVACGKCLSLGRKPACAVGSGAGVRKASGTEMAWLGRVMTGGLIAARLGPRHRNRR